MSLKIKPLEDRVVVEAMAADETTASGIILPILLKKSLNKVLLLQLDLAK